MKPSTISCELCSGEASLYCISDSAYLCSACDHTVHRANFLVARHLRRGICSNCRDFDGSLVSGVGSTLPRSYCRSCSPDSDTISTSSSTCASSVKSSRSSSDRRAPAMIAYSTSTSGEAAANANVVKAEGIFVNWCRKLGLKCDIVVAFHAFSVCLEKFTNLPLRVCFAASLWLSLKRENNAVISANSGRCLKRLEEISGVPVKVILSVEKKISRILKVDRRSESVDLKEGWAEC